MKNKFIIFTLCFTIIFTNINLSNYKSYANNYEPLFVDGGVISAPMVATISSLAVASGIALSSNENIYDVCFLFYQKHKDNWENVKTVFDTCVSIGANKVVTVGNEFLNLVKDCFDTYFTPYDSETNTVNLQSFGSVPSFYNFTQAKGHISSMPVFTHPLESDFSFNGTDFTLDRVESNSNGKFYYYKFDSIYGAATGTLYLPGSYTSFKVYYMRNDKRLGLYGLKSNGEWVSAGTSIYPPLNYALTYDLPYIPGSYSPGGVLDSDNLDIYVPNNVGSLVGSLPSDVVGNPSYEYGGTVTLPNVNSPSIDSSLSGTFNPSLDSDVPGVDSPSIPNDSIWSTIKDFVVSLVVPSDTFWTDTFNGFRDNFSKNFPMLDMSKFDSLAVGGKPFPNLYAYGSKIVDGDVINSIVDWLRPIIAGFIMICLMFFNYRKIYKLIRNTEPFGSIAQGSSDFRTGLSAPPINNGLDSNPMGNLRDALFDMRNEILRRENSK